MNEKRIRIIKQAPERKGPVVYWMSRDQRVDDNWALIFAQEKAEQNNESLAVVFNLVPNFLEATIRQYGFMLKGLQEIEAKLKTLRIPFFLLLGNPEKEIPSFIKNYNCGLLITDLDSLKIKKEWKTKVSENINIPFYEIDAHNIVPCFQASDKEEFAAYTIRSKINKKLPEYLDEFPSLKISKNKFPFESKKLNWESLIKELQIDFSVKEIDWIKPGEKAANEILNNFLFNKINSYDTERNDPTFRRTI